jgi:hypothetical protein
VALTVLQYVEEIRQRQESLAPKLGSILAGMPPEFRVVLTLTNAMTAIVFKVLVERGVCTDAELAFLFDDAVAQAFGTEAPTQPGNTT